MGLWEGNWSLNPGSAPDPLTAARTPRAELLCREPQPCRAGVSARVPPTSTARDTRGEEDPESTSSRTRCHPLCCGAASPRGAPQAPGRSQDRAGPQLRSILWLNSPNSAGSGAEELLPGQGELSNAQPPAIIFDCNYGLMKARQSSHLPRELRVRGGPRGLCFPGCPLAVTDSPGPGCTCLSCPAPPFTARATGVTWKCHRSENAVPVAAAGPRCAASLQAGSPPTASPVSQEPASRLRSLNFT